MNSTPRPEFLYLGHSTVLCTLPSGKIDPDRPLGRAQPGVPGRGQGARRASTPC